MRSFLSFGWLGTTLRHLRNTRPAGRRAGVRPQLEALEARAVPATLLVSNNLDHGAGSLRQAISDAGSGDTIHFAPSVHAITLSSGELDVMKSLTLAGPGASHLSISGNDASRVFNIASGATVTLS